MTKKTLLLALVATLFACRRDGVRSLDAHPEIPAALDFGVLAVDQVKAIPITVSNSGQIELAFQDLQIEEPFDVEVPPGSVVPGGSSDVLVKFQPVQPGEVNKILTLSTSSVEMPLIQVALHGIAYQPQLDLSPDRLDFGDVTVGAQKTLTFAITNNSPVALNVDAEPADDPSDFAVSPRGFLGKLPTGHSATVTVSFAPSVAGAISSSVILDCPVCKSKQVQILGNGIVLPGPGPTPTPTTCTLAASPARVDFGQLSLGQTGRQVVTISSTGTGSCFLQKPYLDATSSAALSATPLEGGELKPGASGTFTATFTPAADTPSQVSGSVVFISNDKDHSPLSIPLSGEYQAPPPPPPPPAAAHLVVAPPSLTFPATQVPAAPPAQSLTLLNDGGQRLTWTATSDDASMTVSSTSGALYAGASAALSVGVAAQAAAGSRTSHLVFDAGAAGRITVPVSITFTAAPPPPPPPALLAVTPLALTFTALAGSAPAPQNVAVSDLGGQALSWSGAVDDAAVGFAATSGTLAAGAAQQVKVSVSASAFAGTRTATLTIDAGAAGKASVALTLVFTAPPPPPPPPQYGGSAWPKWHHDNRSSGLSHVDTSSNVGTVKWKTFVSAPVACLTDGRTDQKTRCGTYVSSPVLTEAGNVVQLGGDGKLYEFDRATGKKVWSAITAPPWISANEGTPTVVKDGSVFLMTAGESHDKSQFYRVTGDGQVVASIQSPTGDGWDSSPALDDDGTLYLSNDDRGTIQGFDQRGVQGGEVTLSPQSDIETQSAALADGIVYWSANGHLWALTPSRQQWSFTDPVAAKLPDWPAHFLHNIKSSPALTPDGKVIYTYVFETTKNGKTVQTTRIYAFQAGSKLKQLWMATLGPSEPKPGLTPGGGLPADYADSLHYRSGITSPAVGPDGTIYVGHCDGLFALDSATGKYQWGVGMAEIVGSPAVGKDGTIYTGSADGMLRAIAPDGTEKWAVKTKGQLNSSPAIGADGTVYAMSDDGYLYAIH